MTGEDTKESPHEPHGEKVPQQPLLQETRPQMGGGDQHDDHAVVNAAHAEELHRDQDLESDTESDAVEHQNGNDSDDPSDDCKTDGNDKWEEMFNRLVEYKKKFGNCLVPNRFPEDPRLGSWVAAQRRQLKERALSPDMSRHTQSRAVRRIDRLNEIGFTWRTTDPRHVPWEYRFGQLKDFVEQYGHSQVPIGWKKNTKLANWVSTQRQEYKLLQKGRPSRLSLEKMQLLDSLDFVWEAQRGGPQGPRPLKEKSPRKKAHAPPSPGKPNSTINTQSARLPGQGGVPPVLFSQSTGARATLNSQAASLLGQQACIGSTSGNAYGLSLPNTLDPGQPQFTSLQEAGASLPRTSNVGYPVSVSFQTVPPSGYQVVVPTNTTSPPFQLSGYQQMSQQQPTVTLTLSQLQQLGILGGPQLPQNQALGTQILPTTVVNQTGVPTMFVQQNGQLTAIPVPGNNPAQMQTPLSSVQNQFTYGQLQNLPVGQNQTGQQMLNPMSVQNQFTLGQQMQNQAGQPLPVQNLFTLGQHMQNPTPVQHEFTSLQNLSSTQNQFTLGQNQFTSRGLFQNLPLGQNQFISQGSPVAMQAIQDRMNKASGSGESVDINTSQRGSLGLGSSLMSKSSTSNNDAYGTITATQLPIISRDRAGSEKKRGNFVTLKTGESEQAKVHKELMERMFSPNYHKSNGSKNH